jgi:hypothetical protein
VRLIHDSYYWIYEVLFWGLLALRAWAAIDCALRKAPAFPAVNKLTKPAWLALTLISAALAALPQLSPLNPLSLIGTVISMVYLADVRPAVREVSGGSRW